SKALKVIDYACGAGHFLNTYANELKRYLTEDELKEHYKNIYGIEKEYRLSKVSKVSSAMYGQNEINILYADALASFELANTNNLEGEKAKPQIESNSFDLLIANPPYSVKGFLETLSDKSKNTYKLFNDDINIETNNSIECFFCERANQILNDNAKAAIILPSSILNKDSIYKNTREILFQNFDFIAIVELGNQTFGATGTNTIILFLRKKETFKQENHLISQDYSLIKERIEAENLKDSENFYQNYLSAYCDFRKFDKELYSNFLNGNLDSKLAELEAFKDYRNAFRQTSDYKKLKESKIYKESKDKQDLEDKAFLAYTQAIEKDKLLYFCLSLNQEVLIIKSPSDIKEQKKFLGYEWSNRKGDEGLKELHEPYLSPLFERGNPQNETKLNTLICKAFLKTLSDIPKDLQGYAGKARLIDMMDFEKVEFNKAISLNPSNSTQSEMSNPFANSKYELVRLVEIENIKIQKGQNITQKLAKIGNIKVVAGGKDYAYFHNDFNRNENTITISASGANAGYVNFWKEKIFASDCTTINLPNLKVIQFIYYVLKCNQKYIMSLARGAAQPHVYPKDIENIKIPLPPLEIQKQIVAECEKVEEQYNTLSLSIKEYQNLIKAILQKCGIIEDNQEYELNSILENLQKLESKLDFNLLLSLIEEQISHSEVLVEETQSKERRQDFNAFKNFSKTIKELLQTLPASPQNGWERVKLKDICNINQETYNPSNDLGEMLYIDIDSVEKETGKINFNDKIPCKNLPTRARRIARADSVIISTVRPYLKGFVYIKDEIKDSIFSTGFAILNGKENIAKSQFVYYCFMFVDDLMRQIEIKMPKSSYPSINTDDIGSFIIPLPPLEIQEKIVQNIELVEQQIDFLNLKLEFLEKEKEKILQKYLFS
ncbi:TPA: restriction endonuclease subunit S, partial [Campylobacter coli]|nr:restriction endonuclease subunit S [Campylobacter coli]